MSVDFHTLSFRPLTTQQKAFQWSDVNSGSTTSPCVEPYSAHSCSLEGELGVLGNGKDSCDGVEQSLRQQLESSTRSHELLSGLPCRRTSRRICQRPVRALWRTPYRFFPMNRSSRNVEAILFCELSNIRPLLLSSSLGVEATLQDA